MTIFLKQGLMLLENGNALKLIKLTKFNKINFNDECGYRVDVSLFPVKFTPYSS